MTANTSPAPSRPVLQIAIAGPLHGRFDYLAPDGLEPGQLQTGCRVRVRFAGRVRTGLIVALASDSSIDSKRLLQIDELLDSSPILKQQDLQLLHWAAGYYHHPEGDTIFHALPVLLRQGKALPEARTGWQTATGVSNEDVAGLTRSPRQQALLRYLLECGSAQSRPALLEAGHSADALKRLQQKALIEPARLTGHKAPSTAVRQTGPQLNHEQQTATDRLHNAGPGFHSFLLQGVTGSGKTEVYLSAIEPVIRAGRQVLVLVPEIALTSQTIDRFRQRFAVPVAVLHSGLTDRQRLQDWHAVASGQAAILIGTRSSVWTPMPELGLVIVDEEHDASYKQQEGLRYSARDVAVMRARQREVPILLGSATPSLESLDNVAAGRYQCLQLNQRAGKANPPQIHLLDCRQQKLEAGLSRPLLDSIGQHLQRREQVLVFINRRGFAPVLLCHECGWVPACRKCDANLTWHRASNSLQCHHCGWQQAVATRCPDCGSRQLVPVGQGTERLEEVLGRHFPEAVVARIDRDTTRQRGQLEHSLEKVRQGDIDILIGTQMLAKGHDFPGLTLVCIIDTDNRLYSADFRATERLAQLLTQVSGRAGRAEKPGTVLIQTHHPDHPLLQTVIKEGYPGFAAVALQERRDAMLPPCSALALLRASSEQARSALEFLQQAWQCACDNGINTQHLMGPLPAPMERRENRYHAQMFVQADSRPVLHRILALWLPLIRQLPASRKIRWSVDVDPQDLL